MEDKYIKGVAISKIDSEITKIIEQVDARGLGGNPMVIGIQNEDGVVYRKIITYGLGSYLDLVQSIARLGLIDLYKDDLNPHKYDSLFVHP
ncbi:hypothetical protein [Gilliamella sp. ESL0254]|uniref:hypothetical protein n=1 Tax=Gilliamella sp. ESL0254 TaxID=2705035 RepID=UPI001580CC87|nr:hypothetical protein [Gilliamella sp. ESL0254]NUF27030.1 hypothetical protein [Gilliamella sp. ESL0254]